MTKQKSTPAVKTIEEAKAKSPRAKGKQRYVATESWLTMFRYWYSPSGKKHKATASAIAIYSFIAGLTEQKKVCYANQETLGEIGSVEPRQVRNIIKMLEDVGVIHVERRKGQTSICTALPFTDAHVIPPDQLPAAPVIVTAVISDQPTQTQAPEPVKAAEEKPDDVPDWFYSKDDVKPKPTAPINRMDAACTILIRNIDLQAETESLVIPPKIRCVDK
jgi:hypothetical protein